MKDLYVWYSSATDVTGQIIQEELGAKGGTKRPVGKGPVLCWGAKTKDNIALAAKKVFNHPDNIRVNRNKFNALKSMEKDGCNVADFSEDMGNAGKNKLAFPLIARTKFHQGGAGFWTCLNQSHLNMATKEGAQYIQSYIDIKDEYRLHVVDGKVVYAVKKVARDNLKKAFKAHHKGQIENFAKKNDVKLDAETLDFVLKRVARKMATSVDMIVRSNTRGWKFSRVQLPKLNKDLADMAIKGVQALGLDFGAVDCCIDNDGKAWIIECNTGPGLEGSSLKAWVIALKDMLGAEEAVKEAVKAPKAKAKAAPKAKKAAANAGVAAAKARLKARTDLMSEMIEAAGNEQQVEALEDIFAKMAEL